MLDLNFVRDNLALVEEKLRQRGMNPSEVLKDFKAIDGERRQAITVSETLQAQRNRASEEIAKLKKNGQDASKQILETKVQHEWIAKNKQLAAEQEARLREILTSIPNLPNASVPVGKSAEDNIEARRWGKPPQFDFQPKPHWELGEQLGILDLERAAKLSGARFAVYWALGARLERALANFMLDLHTREHGYTEILPPFLVNSESMYGTGQLPKFAQDLFRVPHGEKDLWLIPTAEVPVTNLYRDEVLDAARLPVCLTAYTPCFRSEAGSYGKDVRGIIRQHQFQKVELVKFARPGKFLRRTGKADQQRRRSVAETGPALSRDDAMHRRYGLLVSQDLRHRSLAPWPESLSRNFFVLKLRKFSGKAREYPLPSRRQEQN